MKRKFISVFLLLLLTACTPTTQTVPTDEVVYSGEGDYWKVRYIYNPEQYKEKMVSWIEMELKEPDLSMINLDRIEIEIDSRDGLITGNVAGMKTEIEGNTISFLVGTVNFDTYEEDEYQITISFEDRVDVVKLKRR